MTAEEEIQAMRRRAAEYEIDAALLRLQTAQLEHDSAKKTIAMAEKVAQAMMRREGYQ